jgi:hypothetical protein
MKNYLSGELIGPEKWAVTIGYKRAVVQKCGQRWKVLPFGGRVGAYTFSESDRRQFITVVKKCA